MTGTGVSVRLPIGVITVTVDVDDGQGHVVRKSATVTVLEQNTFAGHGEVVTPPDDHQPRLSGETPGRATVTFLGPVTAPGLTWLRTRTDQIPPPPAGKQLGSAPFYYDLATTAVAGGDVRICLDLTRYELRVPRPGRAAPSRRRPDRPRRRAGPGDAPGLRPGALRPGLWHVRQLHPRRSRDAGDDGGGHRRGRRHRGRRSRGPGPGLNVPEGLALDRARNLLYIGEGSHRVRRVNLTDGRIETIAGTGSIEDPVDGIDARLSTMGSIAGLALDADGNLFIGDQSHCLVRRVDRLTNVITTVGGQWRGPGLTCGHTGDGGAATAARLGFPRRLAFDGSGNLLLAELSPLAGSNGGFIRRIAAGPDGRVTGGDPTETIATIAGSGAQDFVSDGVHPLSAGIWPWDLAVGPGGELYVAENNGVLLLRPGADGVLDGSADETVTRVFGTPLGFPLPFQGDGGPARDAWADSASGLAVLPSGDLLVASPFLGRIRQISSGADGVVDGSPDERIATIAGFSDGVIPAVFNGDGYALPTRFAWPTELVTDDAGAIYVADASFHRVRRFRPSSGGGGGTPEADLSITGSAAPDPVVVGGILTYSPAVTNHGPDTAHAVRVSLPIPATVDFVGSSPAGWCTGPAAGTAGTIVVRARRPAARRQQLDPGGHAAAGRGPSRRHADSRGQRDGPEPRRQRGRRLVVVRPNSVVLDVVENIVVTDAPVVTPSVLLSVPETIVVTDTPAVTPALMLHVPETIVVTDTPAVTPSLMLIVPESIVVSDALSGRSSTPRRPRSRSTRPRARPTRPRARRSSSPWCSASR